MIQQFEEHISRHFPELYRTSLILACSGGLDSTVMAHLLHKLRMDFTLAHVNFKLRGDSSDGDQVFVQNLAHQLRVPFQTIDFDTSRYVENDKVSVQMIARKLRYDWFAKLIFEGVGNLVLTAHHADDTLETFLINLSRSSGIAGLCGIPVRNGNIRRPLLNFSRSDLEKFAIENGITWREDASNSGLDYLRNEVRHQIIPIFKQVFPEILTSFNNTQNHLKETRQLADIYLEGIRKEVSNFRNGEWRFSCDKLKTLNPLKPHLYEIFKDFGFTDWKSIVALLESETGKVVYSGTHRVLRNRNELLVRPICISKVALEQKFFLNKPLTLPIILEIKEVLQIEETNPNNLYLDQDMLKEPLFLRKWQKGDKFYPFGSNSSKLVSKFFKDIGLSRFEKEDAWLLCTGNDVLWIVGKRADNRFRITPKTRKILKIKWVEN